MQSDPCAKLYVPLAVFPLPTAKLAAPLATFAAVPLLVCKSTA
jgi:hypothetical protein